MGEGNRHSLSGSISSFNRFMELVMSTTFSYSWCKTKHHYAHFSSSFLVKQNIITLILAHLFELAFGVFS